MKKTYLSTQHFMMDTLAPLCAALAFVLVLKADIPNSARRIAQGAIMPEFSIVDAEGNRFTYTRSSGKACMLAFLSTQQEISQRAVKDIFRLLSNVQKQKLASLQVAFVLQDIKNREFIASIHRDAPCPIQVIDDRHYSLWGKFGIVAKPTVVISNTQGKVVCVKPGYVYDFAPVVKSGLYRALGIPTDLNSNNASTVRALTNNTAAARARRHLNMAKLLWEKGSIKSATAQARAACEIDPNSIDGILLLGQLLCLTGQGQEALKLVSTATGKTRHDKANIKLIQGWALRQQGKLQEAEGLLQEGHLLDPNSPRVLFELGQVYQKRNDTIRAMQTYAQALQLIYREGPE